MSSSLVWGSYGVSHSTEGAARLVVADTCSWLDLIRSAQRGKSFPDEIDAASTLCSHAKVSPEDLTIAISAVTPGEFAANVETVVQSTREALRSLRKRVAHADEVAGHLGIARLSRYSAGAWEDEIVDEARVITEAWLSDAHELDTSVDELQRAHDRTNGRLAPARQGSSATHDCIIVERAMRAARDRPAGSTWFLTSNTRDFAPEGGRLDPALVKDFAACGLEFATSWAEVRGRFRVVGGNGALDL